MKNHLLRNTGKRTFEDGTAAAGAAFEPAEVSRGAAFGDLDNDGDVDLVFTTNNGPARLLINEGAGAKHGWLQIRLEQSGPNRFALGARVGVERNGLPTLWRRVKTDGSYLSASDVRVHVGLGPSAKIAGVVVQWPDGASERFAATGNQHLTLRRGTGSK
jgi:hypothetical protein